MTKDYSGEPTISEMEVVNPKSRGHQPIILANFCRKLHENEKKKLDRGGSSMAPHWTHQWIARFESLFVSFNKEVLE